MELRSPPPFLPRQCPRREIKVDKWNPWKPLAGEGRFDSLVPFFLGKHPDLIEPRSLPCTVPAHAGLGTPTGFAAIGRNKDSHIRLVHPSLRTDRIRKKSMRTPIRNIRRHGSCEGPPTPRVEASSPW